MNQQRQEVEPGVAYILWAFCFIGLCGVHRFYSGKIVSGLLYMFTGGFLGMGQLIDLFLIPSMTRERNLHLLYQATVDSRNNNPHITLVEESTRVKQTKTEEIDPMLVLLKAAAARNNVLSVGQAMVATELPLEKIEALLNQALKRGLAEIGNDEKTGAVRYYFDV